jgi:1,4-alpha-glucan branching enzyme
MTGEHYTWKGPRNFVQLDPNGFSRPHLPALRAQRTTRGAAARRLKDTMDTPRIDASKMDTLKSPLDNDPLWYKDALIYQVHVRSFYDSDDDGYGDFRGLREKLPYLEELGVNTLWLLPFYESPLRDDGYDIADYWTILPVHGALDDFKAFWTRRTRAGCGS